MGTTFREASPQIAISLHFPQPLRVMVVSSGWKENHPKKLKSGKIFAEMAQNYHFPSLCRNHWGCGHLVAPSKERHLFFCRLFHFFMYFSNWTRSKIRTSEVPFRVCYQKKQTKLAVNMSVYLTKSMFWTNEKLSLMVAWSLSVSISRFKVRIYIGHLVCFFHSGNSIVSGENLWGP